MPFNAYATTSPLDAQRAFSWERYNQGGAWYANNPGSTRLNNSSSGPDYGGFYGQSIGASLHRGSRAPRGGMGSLPQVHLNRNFDRRRDNSIPELGAALSAVGTAGNLVQSIRGARAANTIEKHIAGVRQQQAAQQQAPNTTQPAPQPRNAAGGSPAVAAPPTSRTTQRGVRTTAGPLTGGAAGPAVRPSTPVVTGSTARSRRTSFNVTTGNGGATPPVGQPAGSVRRSPIVSGPNRRGGTGPVELGNPSGTGTLPVDWGSGQPTAPTPTTPSTNWAAIPDRPGLASEVSSTSGTVFGQSTLLPPISPASTGAIDPLIARGGGNTQQMPTQPKRWGGPGKVVRRVVNAVAQNIDRNRAEGDAERAANDPLRNLRDFPNNANNQRDTPTTEMPSSPDMPDVDVWQPYQNK